MIETRVVDPRALESFPVRVHSRWAWYGSGRRFSTLLTLFCQLYQYSMCKIPGCFDRGQSSGPGRLDLTMRLILSQSQILNIYTILRFDCIIELPTYIPK